MQIDNVNKINIVIFLKCRKMKKIVFITLALVGLAFKANAQFAVSDGAANAQLAALNTTMKTSNGFLAKLSAAAAATKVAATASESYIKAAQMALLIVDETLKTGMEINNILDRETRIVRKLKVIGNTVEKKKVGDRKFRENVLLEFSNYLNITGSFVDLALNVLTDNVFRMDNSQRREYLNQIDQNLRGIESAVDRLNYCVATIAN